MRVSFAVLLLLIATELQSGELPQNPAVLSSLEAMVAKDQSLRSIDTLDYRVVYEADCQHREMMFDMLAKNEIVSGRAKYLAALLLQHADPTACVECYLLAHKLSLSALDMGYDRARRLAAINLDRYLVFTGKPQKYGTQYNCDSAGHWYMFPIDSAVTDDERAKWGIEPLDSLRAEIDRLNTDSAAKVIREPHLV